MNPGLAPIREPRSIFVSPYSLAPAEPLFDSPIPYLLAKAASTYSLVPAHREAASLLTGKLHHFPLGSCITSHWEAAALSTGKLPYFPTGSFLSSQQESSSLPLRSFLTSHQEAFPHHTKKLRPRFSGSFLTSH